MTEQRFLRLLLYIALVAAGTVLFLRFLLPVLLPFLIGLLLSQLTEPAVRALQERWRFPRPAAAGLTMTLIFLLLSLVLYFLFETCAMELSRLSGRLPELLEALRGPMASLRDWLLRLSDKVPDGLGLALRGWVEDLFSGTSSLIDQGSDAVLAAASGVVTRVPGVFLFLVTTVVASFMISAERQTVFAWLRNHLPETWQEKAKTPRRPICAPLSGAGSAPSSF